MKKLMRAQKSMRAGDGKQCIYLEWPNLKHAYLWGYSVNNIIAKGYIGYKRLGTLAQYIEAMVQNIYIYP